MNKNRSFAALFFLFLFLFIVLNSLPKSGVLSPHDKSPIVLLSNETGDDLSTTIISAIKSAKESLVLSIYTLSDKKVISAINKKALEGLKIILYTDAAASWPAIKGLHPRIHIHLWKQHTLMHQKILIVDHRSIYLGSANFSSSSLNVHRNLLIAFNSEEAADFLLAHLLSPENLRSTLALDIGEQPMEIWMFPAKEDLSKKVLHLIQEAKKCIKIAMFTWTRSDFAEMIAKLKLQGIHVEVILDRSNEKRAHNKVIDILKEKSIPTLIYQGPGLLHHKFLWIDDSTLLSGSTNWTSAAFTQNRESCILIKGMTESQKKIMGNLWKSLKKESRLSH